MDSNINQLLEAFQEAKTLNLCPNRVWAVAGENLHNLLPGFNSIQRVTDQVDERENYDGNEHNDCTPDFCEHSQRDFTAVQQRHECKKKNQCVQIRDRFRRETLDRAARNGNSTVWDLDGESLLKPLRPYMAVSHVWSDGTGTGAWEDGEVNECLYAFFYDIAKQFQCDGIWWDTLCIPRQKAARNKAIEKIQSSYEDARITLVHDCFLRNWTWDPKSACFAILMSPWFSRGWTALELTKSRKVKVIFKGPSGPIIKDLDEQILAEENELDSPRKEASRIIRNLRGGITTLNSLLTMLASRYTSWPKDMATISALLVGVARKDLQQDTYKSILKKFGRLAPGHLFHNATTMSKEFSWCPANLFDLPLDSSNPSLTVFENGDIQGEWRVIPIRAGLEKSCWWNSMHPLMKRRVQDALRSSQPCLLLAECRPGQESDPVARALLVRATDKPSRYQYIGAIYFLQVQEKEGGNWSSTKTQVIISSYQGDEEGMSHALGQTIIENKIDAAHSNMDHDNRSNSVSDERLRCAVWRGDYNSFKKLIQPQIQNGPDKLGRWPLHLAAERGNEAMVRDLLPLGDVNLKCNYGQTALHRAAYGGSAAIVKELLQNGSNAIAKDKDGNTALHIAAQFGFPPIAKLLIEKSDVSVNSCNHVNLTPLHLAAMNGHTAVAELLEGANIEAKDNKVGWTPLHCAAENGDLDFVKLLIERGAEVNAEDDLFGWTPLHLAAMNGNKAVVNLLLVKCTNRDSKDKYGWTARQFAEINGHAEVVELLYSKDIEGADTIPTNKDRWTPLHCKAISNKRVIVEILVHGGADVYLAYEDKGWTPLQFAAENELGTTIRRLLEKGAKFIPNYGQTPLHWAAEKGYKAVTRQLLDTGTDKDAKGFNNQTPLHYAAQFGRKAVVRQLLDAGSDKDARDSENQTPLHWAAQGGHEAVIRQLLDAGVDKEAQSSNGWTPLHRAAQGGHEAAVRQLLKAGAHKEAQSSNGYRPLHNAAQYGHEAVTQLLLDAGAEKDARDPDNQTPLHWAAQYGREAVVRRLLRAGAEKDAKDRISQTPLHYAARFGREAVVQQLLEEDADKDAQDSSSYRPLHQASENGHEAVVRRLLRAGADKDAKGWNSQTPLHYAARFGREAVVQQLLEEDADKDAQDSGGYRPLHRASENGHEAVVRRLLNAGADANKYTPPLKVPIFSLTSTPSFP
ncbi:uncharacterized protein N7511_007817 [Penicillium nucicola]|uniref:uncharacterized protein n=1 Tax=Penicillium nucicola TaxID=1850975 RepID=UPI002544D843|nr:uncharacterized protein N7511_007817 [Penicillium nucicola]KAJ5753664.1 hypothetical protein N7511_007817 [Penicillium nucicola]